MNSLQLLQEVIEFRKKWRGKAVSTSHDFTALEYIAVLPELQKQYTEFTTEFTRGKEKPYIVTIRFYEQKD